MKGLCIYILSIEGVREVLVFSFERELWIEIKISYQLRFFVVTWRKKFIPLVQACSSWIVHNVEFFLQTQHTHASCWVIWSSSLHYIPFNVILDVIRLQVFPEVLWQRCLMDFRIFKRLFVRSVSLFELDSRTSLSVCGVVVMPGCC